MDTKWKVTYCYLSQKLRHVCTPTKCLLNYILCTLIKIQRNWSPNINVFFFWRGLIPFISGQLVQSHFLQNNSFGDVFSDDFFLWWTSRLTTLCSLKHHRYCRSGKYLLILHSRLPNLFSDVSPILFKVSRYSSMITRNKKIDGVKIFLDFLSSETFKLSFPKNTNKNTNKTNYREMECETEESSSVKVSIRQIAIVQGVCQVMFCLKNFLEKETPRHPQLSYS